MFYFVLGISFILIYSILNNFNIVSGILLKFILFIVGILILAKTVKKREFSMLYFKLIKNIKKTH